MEGTDGFEIKIPSVLLAVGAPDLVRLWHTTALPTGHPAAEFVRWYVHQRGLVALAIDTEVDDDRFHEGCLFSGFVRPEDRLRRIEEHS